MPVVLALAKQHGITITDILLMRSHLIADKLLSRLNI